MERGIIKLIGSEKQEALKALESVESSPNVEVMKQRLAINGSDANVEETIQLNEEAAELILDNLSMPQAGEAPAITSLRKKIQQFLARIRFPEQTTQPTT